MRLIFRVFIKNATLEKKNVKLLNGLKILKDFMRQCRIIQRLYK